MASSNINIVVKDLNKFAESQVIICKAHWSVKQLKKHLYQVLPNKPKPRCQNLIYVGKLLRNSSKLINILPTNCQKAVKIHLISTSSRSAKCKVPKKLKSIQWARDFNVKDASTSTHDNVENDEHDLLYETAAREVFEMTGLAESIARNPNDEILRRIYQTYLDQVYFHMAIGNNSINDSIRPCVEDMTNDVDEGENLEGNSDDDEWVDLCEPFVNNRTLAQAQTQTQSGTEAHPQSQAQTEPPNESQARPRNPAQEAQAHVQPPNEAQARPRNLAQEAQAHAQPQNLAQAQEGQGDGINAPEEEPDFIDWIYLGLRVLSVILFAYSNSTFVRSMAALLILIVVSILPNLVVLELHRRAHFNLPRPEIPPGADWLTQFRAILNLFILSLIPDLI